jgi:hypothetical protein
MSDKTQTTKEPKKVGVISAGLVCKYCFEPLAKRYGHEIGCEECGGKAKIQEAEGALE